MPVKSPSTWPNDWATTKIDAAVNWGNGKVYFFRGSEYLRYDITFDRVDPDYPKSIAGNWNGVWDADLDGVLYQGGTKAYFFKGNDYRRYDLDSDSVDASGSIDSLVLDPVPPGMWTAARDMTLDQANLVMGYLIESNKLVLRASQNPYVGSWQTTITSPNPTTRVAVQPDRVRTFEGESNGISTANKWLPKNVEDGKGYMIHPDYVDGSGENLRAHHQDHIHIQVGGTDTSS